MASVVNRDGKWYLRFKDSAGRWVQHVCKAQSKTEAKRLANEMEQKSERQRLGLEAKPSDPSMTLGILMEWWMTEYPGSRLADVGRRASISKHFIKARIAQLPLLQVTPGTIETLLQSKVRTLKPSSINHLRGFLHAAFSAAKRAGKWSGANPVTDVRRRKVSKRLPEYLTVEEVPLVLGALEPRWQALFATAIFTGLRKGELFGLRKSDVNFQLGLLAVCRSYERDTTKGGRAEAIPISRQLAPFLKDAVANSKSELVFPAPDGRMMSDEIDVEKVLRHAMARAGIVTGYEHRCRRAGCGHKEKAADITLRHCPTCKMKLWPKPEVRPMRFHALRHTTASLLMMAGANPAAVQRIMRHTDPRLTTEVYGHLAPDYLRAEVERMQFSSLPEDTSALMLPEIAPIPALSKRHILTVPEVAKRMRLSTKTVYKLIDQGKLAHVRVSNSIRVDPDELDRYLGVPPTQPALPAPPPQPETPA